jgi:hypothetical protein
MNRITRNFFVLIGLATLASGGLWQQAVAVDAGRFSPVGIALAFVSLVVLLTALLGALRILYKTAPANRPTPESHLEDTDA